MSSASSPASGYRRDGSFSRHFRQIVSRSRGTLGWNRVGRTGSWAMTIWIVSEVVAPLNGEAAREHLV